MTFKEYIVVESTNGADNVLKTRQKANQLNLEQDRKVWNLICNIDPSSKQLVRKLDKSGSVKFDYKLPSVKNGKLVRDKDISDRLTSFSSKVANNCASMYGITYKHEVELWMVQDLVKVVLNSDEKIQTMYARNASRQSVDEDAQIATVDVYTKGNCEKPSNGSITVMEGKITSLKELSGHQDVRSVDMLYTAMHGSFVAYVFIKYSGPVGSVTSQHQTNESFTYIKEAIKYCQLNNDKNKFIVQVDGYAGEMHIAEMQEIINESGYNDRIFAGNTEQVIDWINSFDK